MGNDIKTDKKKVESADLFWVKWLAFFALRVVT
jgi:hypothetical protein